MMKERNTHEHDATEEKVKLLRDRREGRMRLQSIEELLQKRLEKLTSIYKEELFDLEELIEEANQVIKDEKNIHDRIAALQEEHSSDSHELEYLQQSLKNNKELFANIPSALTSLLEEKNDLQEKITKLVDNDKDFNQLRIMISKLKTIYGFTE